MSEPVAITETTLRGIKKAIQDFVAPEIRDLKGEIAKLGTRLDGVESKLSTRMDGLEKLMDTQYNAIRNQQDAQYKASRDQQDAQYKAFRDQQDAQYKGILAALGEVKALIGESRAQSELETVRRISALSERVAVLEAARQ